MAAKIFRINYKSDFILTLTSDAGWTTPFCIKFWTGEPAMAYYAGWDGETYTHCAYDPAEPTKLQVQFDDHHLPVGDLKFQIGYHFTVADFPNDTEDEVINPANITVEIDGEEHQVMLDFTGETAPEIEFALPAYANEQQRIANEQQRIANEQERIEAEEQRVTDFGVIERQAEEAISEAGSAAQAAYEAAGEAANVNAELDGTILTITNRQGVSESVDVEGPVGPVGPQGEPGIPGEASTITVGTTTTGAPGTNAQVVNRGTSSAAVLDFTIPRGEPGEVTEAEMNAVLALKEDKANKVTEIGDDSTDTQYPSAKGVWTAIKNAIAAIKQWATSLFARTDGYYSRMIVGGAESLIGDVPQTATYTFRRTGGGAIGEPVARLTEVQGNTGVVNQIQPPITYITKAENGVTFTIIEDGYAIQAVVTAPTGTSYAFSSNTASILVAGHRYVCKGCPAGGSSTTFHAENANYGTYGKDYGNGYIFTAIETRLKHQPDFVVGAACPAGTYIYRPQLIDLTLMYGSGNEPGTVADFEARIWRDYGKTLDEYVAYTTGKLINCKALALESVGQNQWDEEWELGLLNSNGTVTSGTRICSKNYIPIMPNVTYLMRYVRGNGKGRGAFYDANYNLVQFFYDFPEVIHPVEGALSGTFVPPADAKYLKFCMNTAYTNTYSNDICINISDAAINGTYRPYKKDVVNLNLTTLTGINPNTGVREVVFPNGIRSKGDVRDVISGNTATVKIGGPTQEAPLENTVLATPIVYTDIQYADGTPFELPTNFEVQNDGTERITHTDGEDSIAPVMSAIYGLNAVGFVQDAPKDYTSQATLDALLSALSSVTGHTFSKTWDAANGKWVFS